MVKRKHAFTMGQLFCLALDLKHYVCAKLSPIKKIIVSLEPIPIIILVAINLHMAFIQIHVGEKLSG